MDQIEETIRALGNIDTFNCSDSMRMFVVSEKAKLYQELWALKGDDGVNWYFDVELEDDFDATRS